MARALDELEGPVLAHCTSGIRSAIVWAAQAVRTEPVDKVLTALATAGFELNFLRDDLEREADRRIWSPDTPPMAKRLPVQGRKRDLSAVVSATV